MQALHSALRSARSSIARQASIGATTGAIVLSLALGFVLGLGPGLAPGLGATSIQWGHYKPQCTMLASELAVPCGSYGIFHFGLVTYPIDVPPECEESLAGQTEEVMIYPRPVENQQFPMNAPMLPVPPPGGRAFGGQGLGEQESLYTDPWVALVDWNDSHGATVEWLAEAMSQVTVDAHILDLEEPALVAALGSGVSDAHVLAKMCEANQMRVETRTDLLAVNLSLGRSPRTDVDPPFFRECNRYRDSLSCQISHVARAMRTDGITLTAAAGNQGQLLFPAALPDTLAVGTLDIRHYIVGGTKSTPTWESPKVDHVNALAPGHALCADAVVTPAGSSFAAAVFTGWMAQALMENEGLDMYGPGLWEPVVDGACFALGRDGIPYTSCNFGLVVVLDGILHGAASGCWDDAINTGKAIADAPWTGFERPSAPPYLSHIEWVAAHQPAPADDPCVPCMGGFSSNFGFGDGPHSGGTELILNLSSTSPATATAELDSLWLRIGTNFLELGLTPAELALISNGEIGGLKITGIDDYLGNPTPTQSSLIAVYDSNPSNGSCVPDGDPDCWWTSTTATLP